MKISSTVLLLTMLKEFKIPHQWHYSFLHENMKMKVSCSYSGYWCADKIFSHGCHVLGMLLFSFLVTSRLKSHGCDWDHWWWVHPWDWKLHIRHHLLYCVTMGYLWKVFVVILILFPTAFSANMIISSFISLVWEREQLYGLKLPLL